MSIIKQTYFDQLGTVARSQEREEVKQSHIFYAMQRIENQVEQCGGKFDALLHRLRVVSRDPKLAQEDNQSMPKREGNSERNKLWREVVGWGDPSHDDEDLMKAIEAKLKEKNNG